MRQTAPPAFFPSSGEIRHGVHYLPRQKQPSMFEILSWKEKYDAAGDKQWLVHLQEGNRQSKFTEIKKYERVNLPSEELSSPAKNQLSDKLHLHPQNIKHQLFYYGEVNHQAAKKKEAQSPPPGKQKPKKEVKRLNQFDQEENKEIQIRKRNIEKFEAFTRELPNSAFTTYFGKPTFAHYGYGSAGKTSSLADLRSHSVMPHAGTNHPHATQTHKGALSKANVINLESHVPRLPTEEKGPDDCRVAVNEYYNVEIVKPDLINQIKFSNREKDVKFRARTPRHDELNHLPKRHYTKSPPVKKQKPKKKAKKIEEKPADHLAFMNEREGFMKEVKEKERQHQRLAYKVTECYPYDWENQTEAASTAREEKWKQIRPAGISSSHSLNAFPLRSY